MISLPIFGAIASIFLAVGTFFTVKVLREPEGGGDVVPLTNFQDVVELRPAPEPVAASVSDTLCMEEQSIQSQQQEEAYQKEFSELKDQIAQLNGQLAQRSSEAESRLNDLQQANAQLQAQIRDKESALIELRQRQDVLTKDHAMEISGRETRLEELQRILDELRKGETVLAEMKRENERIKGDNEGLATQLNESRQKMEELQRTLQTLHEERASKEEAADTNRLKQECDQLVSAKAAIAADMQKVMAQNQRLMQKEKLMQYELTKSRAQSIGLEKICGDFKIQIEQMTRVAS